MTHCAMNLTEQNYLLGAGAALERACDGLAAITRRETCEVLREPKTEIGRAIGLLRRALGLGRKRTGKRLTANHR